MKATISSTRLIVEISDHTGRRASARVWEGETEDGVRFTAYITQVQVRKGGEAQFNRELVNSGKPDAETLKAIELRYII